MVRSSILGCILCVERHVSLNYLFHASKLTKTKHLGWMTSVKYQDSCGSCTAFATNAAAETALIKAGADLASMDLSEQWPLNCAYRMFR